MDQTPGESSQKRYKGEGRVAFLANLESIRQEVEAGWPLQAVYDRHKDKLNIQYMQFHRYVTKYVKGKTEKTTKEVAEVKQPRSEPQSKPVPTIKKPLNDATPLSDEELF
jgi:hypothetical protein